MPPEDQRLMPIPVEGYVASYFFKKKDILYHPSAKHNPQFSLRSELVMWIHTSHTVTFKCNTKSFYGAFEMLYLYVDPSKKKKKTPHEKIKTF